MAKKESGVYQPGKRTRTWIKLKNARHQEVVVIGWRHGKGERSGSLGSLLLAVPDSEGELRYAGRVGTGFTDRDLEEIAARLRSRSRKTPPVDDVPAADRRDAEWVRADLVGEVQHTERTADGRLRHPVWRGWRPEKKVADLQGERGAASPSSTCESAGSHPGPRTPVHAVVFRGTAQDASLGGDRRRSRSTSDENGIPSPPPLCPSTSLRRTPPRSRSSLSAPPPPGSEPLTTSASPRSPEGPPRPPGPRSAASATSCRPPRLRRPPGRTHPWRRRRRGSTGHDRDSRQRRKYRHGYWHRHLVQLRQGLRLHRPRGRLR